MTTRMAWWTVTVVPLATRATVGAMEAAASVTGALVLVTSLVPVFVVCLVALRARDAGRGCFSRFADPARGAARGSD